MSKFKFGYLTQLKFKREKKNQGKSGNCYFIKGIDKNAETYWIDMENQYLPDLKPEDYLSDFAKQFINNKAKINDGDFSKKAPTDVYPVY